LVSTCRVAAWLDAERLVTACLDAACLAAALAELGFPGLAFPDVAFPDVLAVAPPALIPAINTLIPAAKATVKNGLGLMTSQPWIMNIHTSNLL
jgi:hypothetical protein